jgi:hypothetical protein
VIVVERVRVKPRFALIEMMISLDTEYKSPLEINLVDPEFRYVVFSSEQEDNFETLEDELP